MRIQRQVLEHQLSKYHGYEKKKNRKNSNQTKHIIVV